MKPYSTPSIVALFQCLAILGMASGALCIIYGMKNAVAGLLMPGIGLLCSGAANWALSAVIDYLAKAAHWAEQAAYRLQMPITTVQGRAR